MSRQPAYQGQLNTQPGVSTGTPSFAECAGIQFYASPWVQGTMVAAYFGPVGHELLFPDDGVLGWAEGMQRVIEIMAENAKSMGANAVVGCEMTLEPFPEHRRQLLSVVTPTGGAMQRMGEPDKVATLRLAMFGTGAELRRL